MEIWAEKNVGCDEEAALSQMVAPDYAKESTNVSDSYDELARSQASCVRKMKHSLW